MKLVLIIGSGAVGKMTVGQALMKKTNLRLFHNHMTIEPTIEIFGAYNGNVVQRLRQVIFEEFVKSDNEGMIFTYMWAFDAKEDWEYVEWLVKLFEEQGGECYFVELVAPQELRLERNRTENRLVNKASKRDLELSEQRLLNIEKHHRLESYEGEIPYENYMKIDNRNLTPEEAADRIIERFGLAAKITLRPICGNDQDDMVELLTNEQIKKTYMIPDFTSKDEAIALFQRLCTLSQTEGRFVHGIDFGGKLVGLINDVGIQDGQVEMGYAIHPDYSNRGFATQALKSAIQKVFDAGYQTVKAAAFEGNLASMRVMEKSGMTLTDEEEIVEYHGKVHHCVCYEITRK